MKNKIGLFTSAILAVGLLSPMSASAIIITFDSPPATTATYSEGGFTFTQSPLGSTPHYGDGAVGGQTLNWHDGGANAIGVIVTLTQDSGLNFDFNSFDLLGLSGTFGVSAPGFGTTNFTTTGFKPLNWQNVSSVSFDVGNNVAIDNLNVTAATVPEPATLALMGLGLAGLGFARKRKAA